jgi:LacI family transcriptional regulator
LQIMWRIALVSDSLAVLGEQVLAGAALAPRQRPAHLRLFESWGQDVVAALERWRPDGILAYAGRQLLADLCGLGLPLVAVVENPDRLAPCAITVDEHAVGALAASTLLDRGLSQFAFLAQGHGGTEREAGWCQALSAAGRTSSAFRLMGSHDDGERLRAWLSGLLRPCGLFAYNDLVGIEAIEVCHDLGLEVPGDISIIGADDLIARCTATEPQLSSVQVPHAAIGRESMVALQDLLLDRRRRALTCLPPAGVALRASSDSSAIGDEVVAAGMAAISADPLHILTVDDLARRLGVSRRTLERRFRDALGRGPLAELHRARITRAKGLLLEGWNLPAIADATGFGSLSAFQRCFKRLVGLSPSGFTHRYARDRLL